ncbi:uncharacterized protein LOC115923206 [Strongylocentrotus purpuratus]|uniref:Uncharacterized protein n=1 Tax=Strongylocentrotus purpuratus TaxID=7668 RepID=A0A7M7NP68_STRPU|nr:uncharacterized protein LOC115923206 [Strongylocentrotus purpuratus]
MSDDKVIQPTFDATTGNDVGDQTLNSEVQTGTTASSSTSISASKLSEERNNNFEIEDETRGPSHQGESDLHHVGDEGVVGTANRKGDSANLRSSLVKDEEKGENVDLDKDSNPASETIRGGISLTPDDEEQLRRSADQVTTDQEPALRDEVVGGGDAAMKGDGQTKQNKTATVRRTGSRKIDGDNVKKKRINSNKGRPKSRSARDSSQSRNSFRDSKKVVQDQSGRYSQSKEGCLGESKASNETTEGKVADMTDEPDTSEEKKDVPKDENEAQNVDGSLSLDASMGSGTLESGGTERNDAILERDSTLSLGGTDSRVAESHQQNDKKPNEDDHLASSQSRLSVRDTVTSQSHTGSDGASPVASPRRNIDSRHREGRQTGRIGDRGHSRQLASSSRLHRYLVS